MVVSAQEIEQLVREDGLVELALKLEKRKGIKIDLDIPFPNSTKSS